MSLVWRDWFEVDVEHAQLLAILQDVTHVPEWASGIRRISVLEVYSDGLPRIMRADVAGALRIRDSVTYRMDWSDRGMTWSSVDPGRYAKSFRGMIAVFPASAGRARIESESEIVPRVKVPKLFRARIVRLLQTGGRADIERAIAISRRINPS